jgi:hypothetical protein
MEPDRLKVDDHVEVAGFSHHTGVVIGVKENNYSGLTYSVKVGGLRLDGVNPLALEKIC